MFKFMKSKKGFTLVELMIVVVIIAILVAVAVPIYRSVTTKARISTCQDNQRQIKSQITNYFGTTDTAMTSLANKTVGVSFKLSDNKSVSITYSGDQGGLVAGAVAATFDAKSMPHCPVTGATITATIAFDGDSQVSSLTTHCDQTNHDISA